MAARWKSPDDSSAEEMTKHDNFNFKVTAPDREAPRAEVGVVQFETQHQPEHWSFSAKIREWTALALIISYFVFSIALYTVLDYEATKVFWFLYLAIGTIVAGTTALEAYDGLTPLREARKAIQKAEKERQLFKTAENDLPVLELVFDLVDRNGSGDLASLKQLRNSLLYPTFKVRINVLCRENSAVHALACDFDESLERSGLRIQAIPHYAVFSLAGRISAFLASTAVHGNAIVAIFGADQRPHPHAIRHAVERLLQDNKIDVVQGRSITVPKGGSPSLFSSISNLEHDMLHGLLWPGRSLTWGLSVANDTNAYWRAEKLRDASTASAVAPRNGMDLGYTAAGQRTRTVYDVWVISYQPTPNTFRRYLHSRAQLAREMTVATVRYTKLTFSRNLPAGISKENKPAVGKWTLKTRLAVLYTLPILRLVSHATLQYFCMALALLITRTPTSIEDFSRTIFFPYPISIWLIIGGLVCLVATVFMMYKARSEFVPLWTAPIVVVVYPIMLFFQALVDVYGQLDAVAR
ncbi:Hypothetical protein R9X50_00186100 [Acrodontium crateriforme]|uniref:Uncharacterized protein n=1 Tax=Acrodontium crateriforme TaxID=150365 RepID=A0AAQ3M5X1_9PEZI|nr:Hypothetical protein R9X50_00186100 [Acrodontium crateriforme]